MHVPVLDLKAQYKTIQKEIEEVMRATAESQYFVLGPAVKNFEQNVASFLHVDHAVGVASGTDALLLSLKTVKVGPGDEVITTPFTFFATAGAIVNVGARPVFVDIDPVTCNIDPQAIEKAISSKTKAIIPVHLFGQCADMDPITALAKKHDLAVIEDACQAIGATYKGRTAGTLGDTGCFSFFPSKNLGGFGDGGMITTNNADLAERLLLMRVHGSRKKYIHEFVGFNSRLDALQAAILDVKLRYLAGWLDARRERAERYNELFKDISGIAAPVTHADNEHTYHQYTIRIAGKRDEVMQTLKDHNIGCSVYYPLPLHLQECFKELGYHKGDLPHTEQAADAVLSLPIYPELTDNMQDYVVETIKKVLI